MPRLMALDVGGVRIGVALSDPSGFLASPYTTLHVSSDEATTRAAIRQLLKETEAEGLVVGLPISLDGGIHTQAERVMAFTERLRAEVTLPIHFWNEQFSTVDASRLLAERGIFAGERRPGRGGRRGSGRGRKLRGQQEIDALAATVILQDYLDQHPRSRAEEIPEGSGQTEDKR